MIRRFALSILAFTLIAPIARSDAPKADEMKKLEGEWQAVEVEINGKKRTNDDDEVKKLRVVIKGNNMTIRSSDGAGAERKKTFKIDPSKSPKEIDITSLDGQEKDQIAAGIYKFEKDRLIICIPNFKDPTVRPKEFKAGADDGVLLVVLERVPSK
jgi:uncharacterized protein (TIGR03067 family)